MVITDNERKHLNSYMKEIRVDLLTVKDEIRLSSIINSSTSNKCEKEEAIKTLMLHNLRYVITVSKKYIGKGLSLPDIIAEGNIGLYEAAKRYNYEEYKTKFISFAVNWIKQSILYALSDKVRTVRVPQSINAKYNEYRKVTNTLLLSKGSYSLQDVSNKLCISEKEVQQLECYMKRGCSFDDPISNGEDDDNKTVIDNYVPDDTSIDIYEIEHQHKKLHIALNKLETNHKEILMDYYGINREYPSNKDNIAKKFNVTTATVNNIIKESTAVLKYLI